jgi:uncharacterized repeat protein (TIGR03803 family)
MLRHLGLVATLAVAVTGVFAQGGRPRTPVDFKTLYQFTAADGSGGYDSNLLSDRNGGFFGTTEQGGDTDCSSLGCGTVYHLTPPPSPGGAWTKTMLYSFTGYPNDGLNPSGPLALALSGTLYGVTTGGGNGPCTYGGPSPLGCGTVYSLTPPAEPGGAWTETVLYNFTGGSDGNYPATVTLGPDDVLYGVTSLGAGSGCFEYQGCGAAFSLSPPAVSGEAWTLNVLYAVEGFFFSGGANSLIVGPNQVLYGTTGAGTDPCEMNPCGTVFSLTPPATPGGAWTQAVLHGFTGWPNDGNSPNQSLALGPSGELYGTTYLGGAGHPCGKHHIGCGTVFELTPPASPGGDWTETILFSFPAGSAPRAPAFGVVIGKDGVLYGSTRYGGVPGCQDDYGCGAVFALTPPASPNGAWAETILHPFTGGSNGAGPFMIPAIGKDGALYGTTSGYGGESGNGTVFVIKSP